MNTRRSLLVLAIVSNLCLAASGQEHLEPEEGELNAQDYNFTYAAMIRAALLKDAPTYYRARMICLPSFRPEWVVTLVREDQGLLTPDEQLVYFVDLVSAEKVIWNLEDDPKIPRKVSVKKSRVKIDRATAEAVHEVWRRMLRGVRYPTEVRLGTDGETYHFSRRVPMLDRGRGDPSGGFEDGQIWSPDEGSLTAQLVTVGETLKKYALATTGEREKVRSELRDKVERLKAQLDRAGQPK